MEIIHNTTKVDKMPEIDGNTSRFFIKDNQHLIVSVIHAPVGTVDIKSTFTLSNDKGENPSQVPLSHMLVLGNNEEILTKIIQACAQILITGQEKNAQQQKKLIVPSKGIVHG